MHTHAADPKAVIIAPDLVAAALDCLAVIADLDPVGPVHIRAISEALGCREPEATALTLRIIATVDVMHDQRWQPWSRLHKSLTRDGRCIFDGVFIGIVATKPIDARGRFDADSMFAALLDEFADPQTLDAAGSASAHTH